MALADDDGAGGEGTGGQGATVSFTIEKLQRFDGSSAPYTTGRLTGKVGQRVDYEIIVKNTSSGASCESGDNEAREENSGEGSSENSGEGSSENSSEGSSGESSSDGSDENSSAVETDSTGEVGCGCESAEHDSAATDESPVSSDEGCGCESSERETSDSFAFGGSADSSCGDALSSGGSFAQTSTGPALTLSALKDSGCEGIAGGPSKALQAGESATYTCHHTLTGPGSFENTASITATPPAGEGQPVTHSSNTVVASAAYEPAFTIEKLQKLDLSPSPYSSNVLPAKSGQTVDYEVIVKNTGNTALTLSALNDPGCEGIAGGPSKALAAGESATYTCHHTLTGAGAFENTASITATPPAGEGQPVTHSSNTVVASAAYEPAFTIEILQKVHGAADPFTRAQLSGQVGQGIDYEILVKNTGNAAMTFATFSDSACDAGSVSGGPGAGAVTPGELTTYYCKHQLTLADLKAGTYPNSVTITGSAGEVSAATSELSNTVVVALAPTSPPPPAPPAVPTPTPSVQPLASVASAAPPVQPAGRAAVLAVPVLRGPSGCVRASFTAAVASASVKTVTFSLDGRRLKRLSGAQARGGTLSVMVDVSRLALGAHRLLAAIAMQSAGPTSRTAASVRTLTFLRCGSPVVTPKFTG